MPNRLLGRSRTCPLLAVTSKSDPRYLLIVLALAGDSTMTRLFFVFRAATAVPLGEVCGSKQPVRTRQERRVSCRSAPAARLKPCRYRSLLGCRCVGRQTRY